jgi:hypothetical protein
MIMSVDCGQMIQFTTIQEFKRKEEEEKNRFDKSETIKHILDKRFS